MYSRRPVLYTDSEPQPAISQFFNMILITNSRALTNSEDATDRGPSSGRTR